MSYWLNHLNENQRSAVVHHLGPLLILAGAGSGKTSTMTHRIAYLAAEYGVHPKNILGLSFTRKAADELKTRVRKLLEKKIEKSKARQVTITTFHSLCVRILRNYSEQVGYQKNFTIIDSNDQQDLLKEILKQFHLDDRKFDSDVLGFEISQAKNRFLAPHEAEVYFETRNLLHPDYKLILGQIYSKYTELLAIRNSVDFDDLIFLTVKLLESSQDVRNQLNDRFQFILVDEYQDTNPAQSRILKALTQKQQNICVVGDDDQSIYTWRGADPSHILNFSKHYPGARIITLDQNYRSTTTILEAANKVIAQNRLRHPKSLWSKKGDGQPIEEIIVENDREESELVASEILKRARTNESGQNIVARPWKDFAILYRSNPQSRVFEEALRLNAIPYKLVGAMSFLDRKEVKDILSYWRVLINPKDDASLRRIINWPARGFGKTALEKFHHYALENKISFYDALSEHEKIYPRVSKTIQSFQELMEELRVKLGETPCNSEGFGLWAKWCFDKLNLKSFLLDEANDPVLAQKKWENIEEVGHAFAQLPIHEILGKNLETEIELLPQPETNFVLMREFLARMTLNSMDDLNEKKEEEQKDQVTLLTLHGSKGLEFPVVFLVGFEEGFLPHKRTIEEAHDFSEERRLCYVGITRAKEHLIITRAKNRMKYGKAVPRLPSRFLAEIPEELLLKRDESHFPDLSSKKAQIAHEERVSSFLNSIKNNLTKDSKPSLSLKKNIQI